MLLFSPTMRFFWEGIWAGGFHEPRRQLFDCELVYCSAGEFTLEIEGVRHRMRQGSLAIVPPQTWHESWTTATEQARRHCVHFDWVPGPAPRQKPIQCWSGEPFDTKLVNPVPAVIAAHLPLVSHQEAHAAVLPVMEMAVARIRQEDPLGVYLLWPVLNTLLMQKSGAAAQPAFPSKTARAVFAVRDFIETHYPDPQDYRTYRDLTRLSASHLCQAFSAFMGRPPLTYLNDLRLHHACRLLQQASMNVSEVAVAVGIPDPNYFARLFRRKFGVSPTRFLASK